MPELPEVESLRLSLVPALTDMPAGCAFRPRCPQATDRCESVRPDLVSSRDGRQVACLEVNIDG